MDADLEMEQPLNSELDSQLPVSRYHGSRRGNRGVSNITASLYLGMVMMGSVPKMLIIAFCVVVAAYTIEIRFASTDSAGAAYLICYDNPKALASGHRICYSLMATAISSIMVCMMLMIIDLFIPCVNTMFKRLAHGLSLMLSIIMGLMFLVTTSLMWDMYKRYCDYIKIHEESHYYYNYYNHNIHYPDSCGTEEMAFLILPFFGCLAMIVWGFNGSISIVRLVVNK